MLGGLLDRLGPPSKERRLVLSLCVATLLLWMGSSSILPLLPIYLRRHGTKAGLVGVVMAAYYAASVVAQYPAGRLSDRIGRRPVMLAGLAGFAAGSVGFASTAAPGATIVFRALQGAGAGAVTVASAAMIGAELPEGRRGSAFGALYGSQNLALAIGPMAGSLVGASSMAALFLGATALAALASLPVLLGGRRPSAARGAAGIAVTGEPWAAPGYTLAASRTEAMVAAERPPRQRIRFTRAVVGAVLVFAATGVIIGTYETTWTLLLKARGASNVEIGLSWTLFALPFALLSVPAGRLADRVDRRLLCVGSLAASALFAVAYTLIHLPPVLVGLAVFEAVGTVAGIPAAVVVLSGAVSSSVQGEAQGAAESARTGFAALGAALSGALFGIALAVPFDVMAGVLLTAAAGVAFAWRGGITRPVARAGGASSSAASS